MTMRLVMESLSPKDVRSSSCYEINRDDFKNLYGSPASPSSHSVKMEIALRMSGPKATLDIDMIIRNPALTDPEKRDPAFANALKASIAQAVAAVLTEGRSALPSNSEEINEVLSSLLKDFHCYGDQLSMERVFNTIKARIR